MRAKKREENMVRINFDISQDKRNAFKAKVASQGLTTKDVLNKLVDDYLNQDKSKEKSGKRRNSIMVS
jgi:uncharacterized protein YpmS